MALVFSCSAHQKTTDLQNIPLQQPLSEFQGYGKDHPDSNLSDQRKLIMYHAIESLSMPYKWGGNSPEIGFDCSGLCVYTHERAGILIPRTAKEQFNKGKMVSRQNLEIADLVFFKKPGTNKIYHVGIYMGDDFFIHAPGKGRQVTYGYMGSPYFKEHYAGSRTYLY